MKFISFNQFIKVLESQRVNEETSGQKDYGEFMNLAKSTINFVRKKSKYPKLKRNESDLVIKEEEAKGNTDLKKAEYISKIEDQVNKKIEASIEAINQKDIPSEQKKIERDKLRNIRSEAIEKAKDAAVEKLKSDTKRIENQFKLKKKKFQDELNELEQDYPIKVDSLQKKWEAYKAKVDLEVELEENDKLTEIKLKLATDIDSQQRIKDLSQKREQQIKAQGEKRVKDLEVETKEAEKELDDKINNAGPDTKDALTKIKDFNSKLSKFVQLSSAYNEDSTKEEKDEIITARKELNAVKDKITPFLLQKAGMATKDNSEDLAATFANDVKDALAEYEELESASDTTDQGTSTEVDNEEGTSNTETETQETPAEQTNKEAKSKRINDYIEKAKKVLANIKSNPSVPADRLEAIKTAIQDKIQKKKDELLSLPENVLNYDIKLSVIKRDLDKIMEEIDQLSKPWISNKNLISESISQKFERIIKG
jgi:hypothetical protein